MATLEFSFEPGLNTLQPAQPSGFQQMIPVGIGPSLTLTSGQAMGRKTSDNLCYPLNPVATDGTNVFAGFLTNSCATDASSNIYLVFGGSGASPTFYGIAGSNIALWNSGIFNPNDIRTFSTGTPLPEIDTITVTTPTTGDVFNIELPGGDVVTGTVGGTQTATAITTILKAAWAANQAANALATATGTTTLILTAKQFGVDLNLTATGVAANTGTIALVITQAAVAASQAEVDTFTPSGAATGDTWTLTINYPNNTTHAVGPITVGATTTATAVSALMIAAWNADDIAANYATATGTATVILTGAVVGNTLNITSAVTGSVSVSKVVTKPAYGANITDLQLNGRPGAYVGAQGLWYVP